MIYGITKQLEIVKKFLGRYASLTKKEAEELADAYKEIERIQKSCYHKWETTVMFTSSVRTCIDCGIEESKSKKADKLFWDD